MKTPFFLMLKFIQ